MIPAGRISRKAWFQTGRAVAESWGRVWGILAESGLGLTYAVLAVTLLEAALSIGSLYAIKLLVDAIGAGLVGTSAQRQIFFYLGLTGLTLLLAALAQSAANLLRMQQGMVVGDFVDRKIHARAIELDLSFYESPHYFDSLQKAREAGTQRPAQVVGNVISFGRGAVVLVAILAMLAAIEWRLLPMLLVTVGLALGVRLLFTRRMFDWRMQRAQMERKAGYLDWMITSNHHAKELRLNHLGGFLSQQYSEIRQRVRSEQLSLETKRLVYELTVTAIASAVFIATAAYLVNAALQGNMTLGQVVMFVLLLRRAEGAGNEVVSGLSRLVDDHLYLGRLFSFLDTKPTLCSEQHVYPITRPLHEGVKLEKVSFVYDGATTPSLDRIDFQIKPRQIVALVGENGSGKTTLIKLLTRLYDPTSGRLTLDGQDIRTLDLEAYRHLFSVIFQDYAMYPDTLANNIWFGDVGQPFDRQAIIEAAEKAGAASFIDRLARNYDTPLTKLFDDGHDLSLGQWQRLALARAFFPPSQFVIMDEPTSAVDPAAEYELFENFRDRLGDRSALIISHRLSTVRQADYTYVLEGGKVIESGTHDELIAKDGAYAALFSMQAKHYR